MYVFVVMVSYSGIGEPIGRKLSMSARRFAFMPSHTVVILSKNPAACLRLGEHPEGTFSVALAIHQSIQFSSTTREKGDGFVKKRTPPSCIFGITNRSRPVSHPYYHSDSRVRFSTRQRGSTIDHGTAL